MPPLTAEESQIAQGLFKTLIDFARERTSKGHYQPAVLIEETFQRIQCQDDFLEYFLTYMYTNLAPEEERRVDLGFCRISTYFRDLSSWDPRNKSAATETMETMVSFAEILIDNFFMPRELIVSLNRTNLPIAWS